MLSHVIVYTEDQAIIDELVFNEKTIVWFGELSKNNGRVVKGRKHVSDLKCEEIEALHWDVGQFHQNTLDIVMEAVQKNFTIRKCSQYKEFNFGRDDFPDCNLRDVAWISRVVTSGTVRYSNK